jgi:hypothetical protein
MARKRDYKKEYKDFHAKPEQKKRRAGRNKARSLMEKAGKVKKGQDVDHKDMNPRNNKMSNLRAQSVSKNRSRNGKKSLLKK